MMGAVNRPGWLCLWLCTFDDFCEFERVRIVMFVDCFVGVCRENRRDEVGEVSHDSGFDLVDVACFVSVDLPHNVGHFFESDVSQLERWAQVLLLWVSFGWSCARL